MWTYLIVLLGETHANKSVVMYIHGVWHIVNTKLYFLSGISEVLVKHWNKSDSNLNVNLVIP